MISMIYGDWNTLSSIGIHFTLVYLKGGSQLKVLSVTLNEWHPTLNIANKSKQTALNLCLFWENHWKAMSSISTLNPYNIKELLDTLWRKCSQQYWRGSYDHHNHISGDEHPFSNTNTTFFCISQNFLCSVSLTKYAEISTREIKY